MEGSGAEELLARSHLTNTNGDKRKEEGRREAGTGMGERPGERDRGKAMPFWGLGRVGWLVDSPFSCLQRTGKRVEISQSPINQFDLYGFQMLKEQSFHHH